MRASKVARLSLYALVSTVVVACGPPSISYWRSVNAGATQQTFSQARFSCLQQTTRPQSSAFVTPYGGAAQASSVPYCSALFTCMSANGFYQSSTTDRSILNRPGVFWVSPNEAIECIQ